MGSLETLVRCSLIDGQQSPRIGSAPRREGTLSGTMGFLHRRVVAQAGPTLENTELFRAPLRSGCCPNAFAGNPCATWTKKGQKGKQHPITTNTIQASSLARG